MDDKSRVVLQKRESAGFLVVGTCLAKFDYDLDLDQNLQFLSSLGLNALPCPVWHCLYSFKCFLG